MCHKIRRLPSMHRVIFLGGLWRSRPPLHCSPGNAEGYGGRREPRLCNHPEQSSGTGESSGKVDDYIFLVVLHTLLTTSVQKKGHIVDGFLSEVV